MWTKIPASCAGRDSGLLWGLFFPMGFSCSSKCRRVLPFPVASSKVRSRTSFFSLGIAAFAASRRSAALSDFRIYLSSSGVARSSSVNCKREDFSFAVASACAFLAAFLLAFLVRAPSIRSKTRSAAAVSCSRSAPGAWGSGGVSVKGGEVAPPGRGCAACSGCGGASVLQSPRPYPLADTFLFPGSAFTSTAPSRVIFCVTFSRALYCFMCLSLQSAPLQGRNTRRLSQCYIMPVKLLCGCPRRAAAEKGVKHNAAFRTARLDTGFGKFWRERGEMPAL